MYSLSCFGEYNFPQRPYVLDIYRISAGLLSIDSTSRLSLFAPDKFHQGPILSLTASDGLPTILRPFSPSSNVVCTGDSSGKVLVWDLRQGSSNAIAAQFEAAPAAILSLACEEASHTIAVGTELDGPTASIQIWDMRNQATLKSKLDEVHSDDVTELAFHPHDPTILLSGSTDGLVNIYDTKIQDQDEVTIQTFNHDASIHHAGFMGNTSVFALSHDERFAVYTTAEDVEKGSAEVDFGDLRELLGSRYVANVFSKTDGSGAIVAAGCQERQQFTLVHLSRAGLGGWAFDPDSAVVLPGGHGEELVRSCCFYDEDQVIFTAGEDGNIRAWRPGS